MENIMVFDGKMKARMGIICFIPIICFALCLVYYLTLIFGSASANSGALGIVGVTNRNYNNLFFMLATSAVITAPVFIYCLVIIARLKNLNSAHKLMWIIFLSVFAPIASAIFWLALVKDANESMPVYSDMD